MTPAELLELSAERDGWLRRMLRAWADGYAAAAAAHAGDYDAGYADGLAGRKRAEHDATDALALYRARWTLRGQARTRRTFAEPHPDDFPGRGAA